MNFFQPSFKLAAILEGIHFRYLQGKTVGPGFEHVGHSVALLLDTGLSALTDRY